MNLPEHDQIAFEYDTSTPLSANLELLSDFVTSNKVSGIVGHSLGGVMSALMVKRGLVPKGITIAAPLGGFNVAVFLPFTQLMVDLASTRPIFKELSKHDFKDSLLNLTTAHTKWTDGVVSLASQNSVKTNVTKKFDANHFEILLESKCSAAIKDYFWGS